MDERIKTGISGYDSMLGGGYVPESINLIAGCSGAGKTLFTVSYLYNGALTYKQKGVYITLEEMKEHIVRDCQIIGLDFTKIDDDMLNIYDMSSLRVNAVNTKDEVDSDESPLRLDNLLEFIKLNYSDVTRLGLDSIVPIAIAYHDDHVFRAELFRFMMSLKKMGITVVFTTEIPYSSTETSRFGMEDFLADSVTVLRVREEWGRQIKVHKMRGSNHVKNFVDYDISPSGLKVIYK
jgi:KaiC/GvpD/RAD55 family RecA-like ATPase